MVAGFLAGPLYLRSFNRRRMAQLLGPEVDAELRALAGIRSWGLLSEVLIVRELASREPSVPLGASRRARQARSARVDPGPDEFALSSDRFPWSITWREGVLVCRGCGAAYAGSDHLILRPSSDQWAAFWEVLDELGAWFWKGDYSFNERIQTMGGRPWTFSVRRSDRAMECRGNANNPDTNPPGFAQLVEAVLQLLRDGTIESTAVCTFVAQKLKY